MRDCCFIILKLVQLLYISTNEAAGQIPKLGELPEHREA